MEGAQLIFTGDELLRGDIVNTNQAYLGDKMLDLGLFATHALSVTDDLPLMVEAIRAAVARQPAIVVVSGGLGPTEDDLTREAMAEATGRPLEMRDELLAAVSARFEELGLRMAEPNRKQALLPAGATAIPLVGTAPGFWLIDHDVLLVALPGVPTELVQMWEETVEPLLRQRLTCGFAEDAGDAKSAGDSAHMRVATGAGDAPGAAQAPDTAAADRSTRDAAPGVIVRRLRIYGIGESTLAEMLADLPWRGTLVDVGTRASLDGITLVLRSAPSAEAKTSLEQVIAQVRGRLRNKIYSEEEESLAEVLGKILRKRNLTIATAESCTGGLVAKKITDTPGSSDYFVGGVIAYSNEIKTRFLGVSEGDLAAYGAVSEEVAAAMAVGAAQHLGADCSIATTGIAGPGGGTAEKPVGLVYIATGLHGIVEVQRYTMFRTRVEIRERTAQTGLDLLRRRLWSP